MDSSRALLKLEEHLLNNGVKKLLELEQKGLVREAEILKADLIKRRRRLLVDSWKAAGGQLPGEELFAIKKAA